MRAINHENRKVVSRTCALFEIYIHTRRNCRILKVTVYITRRTEENGEQLLTETGIDLSAVQSTR